jgi:protein-disulfide isomerase
MARRAQMPKSPAKTGAGKATGQRRVSPVVLLVVAVAAVVIVVVGIVLLQSQAARTPVAVSGVVGAGTSWGPQNAKLLIQEYSDFGCTHCRNFALDAGKRLRADYEAGGNVRFEYKYFVINPPDTANAANAAECAADQGRFWDYHDVLFGQQGVSQNPFAKSALKQYAVQLGLDSQQFNSCVDNDTHLDKVYRDSADGANAGVTGTPTFFINGQKYVGDLPYEELKADVDAALGAAQ